MQLLFKALAVMSMSTPVASALALHVSSLETNLNKLLSFNPDEHFMKLSWQVKRMVLILQNQF